MEIFYSLRKDDFDDSDIEEHQEELKKALEGEKEQYFFVSYKCPVARFGEKELEESIRAFSVPKEFLIFYYELSDEEINFYRSLVE